MERFCHKKFFVANRKKYGLQENEFNYKIKIKRAGI